MALAVKNLPASAGDVRDTGSIPGSGRSPGGRHSNPLQYSCLENPMDRGAWRVTVHRVAQSDTAEATARTQLHARTSSRHPMCTGCQWPRPTPGVGGPHYPHLQEGDTSHGMGTLTAACLRAPGPARPSCRQSARVPALPPLSSVTSEKSLASVLPPVKRGAAQRPPQDRQSEMSRPRAQDSVRPRKRPAHSLAVGAASLARGWSVCLTCSAGGGLGGCLWHRQESGGDPSP